MLKQRILTAVVLGVLLLVVLFALPKLATVWLITLLVLVGAWEWAAFIRAGSLPTRIGFVAVIAAAVAACNFYLLSSPWVWHVMLVATIWWFIALFWVMLAPERSHPVLAALAGFLALVPCWVALVVLATWFKPGSGWVLFILAVVWAADTGAFFAGKYFGKVPLAPRVSPKKTWEGVIGGLLLSAVVAYVGGLWLGERGFGFISLCIAVAAISVVGDLTESLLKRASGLKDSGSLFPGHGGMLDRIDSVTAAAPVFLCGIHFVTISQP